MTPSTKLRRGITTVLAIAVLAAAPAAFAHHSISMIEIYSPMWLKGSVLTFRAAHPHVMITMTVASPDGRTQVWTIEGPNLMRLERMHADGNFLTAGDVIEVCGFPRRETHRQFLHGHLLVMPDGHRRLFGPYGKLDNCIRPGDAAKTWLEFLAADPLGRQAWCNGLVYRRVPSVAPDAVVDEINRGLTEPCR